MDTPYLVQRGTILRPLGENRKNRLSKAVDFDYMGAAEFEFGAIPKSFRAMEKMADKASLTVLSSIQENGNMLRVFHFFSEEEFKEYERHLLALRQGTIRTKERTSFQEGREKWEYDLKTDFWWDIKNHVIWSFDKAFMSHISEYVAASLNFMNAAQKTDTTA